MAGAARLPTWVGLMLHILEGASLFQGPHPPDSCKPFLSADLAFLHARDRQLPHGREGLAGVRQLGRWGLYRRHAAASGAKGHAPSATARTRAASPRRARPQRCCCRWLPPRHPRRLPLQAQLRCRWARLLPPLPPLSAAAAAAAPASSDRGKRKRLFGWVAAVRAQCAMHLQHLPRGPAALSIMIRTAARSCQ